MKLFTTSYVYKTAVWAERYDTYNPNICVADARVENWKVKQYKLFGRWTVFAYVVEREEVPIWAFCQMACCGHSDWKSELVP